MVSYYITSVSGWLMIVLLIVTIVYPFLLRIRVIGPVRPFLQRMRLHYWLGYYIAVLVLIHAWVPMSGGLAGNVNATGLDLATVALFLVFIQVMLGRRLAWSKLPLRGVVRRWHFWIMIGIVTFVLGHVVLNSSMIQLFISVMNNWSI